MDRGAVESWLVRMLGHARKRGLPVDWTFYCALGRPGALDDAARAAGARIVYSPAPLAQKSAFVRALRAELARTRYAVMHCHHDLISAVYMVAATGLGIPRRIVHAHNADEHMPTASALKRRLGLAPMRRICLGAERVVGISNHTLDTMLGGRPRRPGRDFVHYYGVDPTPFDAQPLDRAEFRRSLDVAEDAQILLFGGRIVPEKNPVFAVDVIAALRRSVPKAALVYAGTGSLEEAVRARARSLNVTDAVRLIGWRGDLPAVMAACDLFVLPRPERPMEGFGLAVVEAQLAGLNLLLSRGIPDDALLPTAVFRRLALADGAESWARSAAELLAAPRPSKANALAALAASPMDMDRALADLQRLHL
jgi:glycosyltransferase involved in cell wall biosynthesis